MSAQPVCAPKDGAKRKITIDTDLNVDDALASRVAQGAAHPWRRPFRSAGVSPLCTATKGWEQAG